MDLREYGMYKNYEGYSRGNNKNGRQSPCWKGRLIFVLNFGSVESGLLENSLPQLRDSKSNKSSDYHTETDKFVFSDWCEPKLIQQGRRGCKICLSF